MTTIVNVTREEIRYIDDNGATKSIDLSLCNKNWVENQRVAGNELSKADAKYIGWRNVCGKPPYIIFFTELDTNLPSVRLEFEYSTECEVLDQRFWNLLDQLKTVGWRTVDLS
jgi:hypothetical protein